MSQEMQTCTIEYRYICDKCSYLTKWYKSNVESVANHGLEESEFVSFIKKMIDKSARVPIVDAAVFEQFRGLFAQGASCPKCKSCQPWYLAGSAGEWKQANSNNNLEVVVGEPTALLAGDPDAIEFTTDTPTVFTTRDIYKPGVQIEKLGYRHLRGAKHYNVLYVQDVTEPRPSMFSIVEEQFESIPLSELLIKGISEKDFQDFIMQLFDALEFLHNHKPGISHNAISPEHILVGKGNLLKLAHFDEATVDGSPLGDIAMLGKLMGSINAKYIKKYQQVMDNCAGGAYKTIDDLRQDFLPYAIKLPVLLFALAFIVMAFIFIVRRVL